MKDWKLALILKLIEALLKMLKPEVLLRVADKILDYIEDEVAESENKIDDITVLPLIAIIRNTFGIPDDD